MTANLKVLPDPKGKSMLWRLERGASSDTTFVLLKLDRVNAFSRLNRSFSACGGSSSNRGCYENELTHTFTLQHVHNLLLKSAPSRLAKGATCTFSLCVYTAQHDRIADERCEAPLLCPSSAEKRRAAPGKSVTRVVTPAMFRPSVGSCILK